MRTVRALLVLMLVSLLLATHPALAAPLAQQEPPAVRDDAFEREVLSRLSQISPGAVPVFQKATQDWDAGNDEAARAGFERVLESAPNFPDALRRLANAEMRLDMNEQALGHARAAYGAAKTPANASTLADVLLSFKDDKLYPEALTLAQEGVAGEPDSAFAQEVLVQAAAASDDMPVLRAAIAGLLKAAPDYPVAHYYAGLLALGDEKWTQAKASLLKAEELGLPHEVIAEPLAEADQHVNSQANQLVWLTRLGLALGAWFVIFGMLFAAGLLLSRLTLIAVRRPYSGEARLRTGERVVRSIYGTVIALTSIFFYLSLPLLAAVIILAAGGLIYVQLRAGRINVYLLVGSGLVGLYTVLAIVRSVFTRGRDSEPGRALQEDEAPRLWALARQIAAQLRTRPVDAIYLTPAVEVAVTERGPLLRKLRGAGRRCLIIGMAALPGMTEAEFSAILAHEYGHFANRDTAGGNLAHQVNLSMHAMAYRLAVQGLARWYNPAWWFINGFSKLFFRITLGASRLREILADRMAAMTYGGQNLIDGLTRIVRQGLAFDLLFDRTVRQAMAQGRGLPNLYESLTGSIPDATALEGRFAEIMSKPTSPYDSHPAVSERIQLVRSLPAPSSIGGNAEPATNLFAHVDVLQNEMLALVQGQVVQGEKDAAKNRAAQLRQAAKASVPEVGPYYEELAQAVERRDYTREAAAWDALAGVYDDRDLPARAASCYEMAATCYADLADQNGERVARYNKAEVYKDQEAWADAELELRKVVALDEVLQSEDLITDRSELADAAARAAGEGKVFETPKRASRR